MPSPFLERTRMPDPSPWPRVVDLQFLGRAGRIAAGVVPTPAGALLVDPGPASCLPALLEGLAAHGIAPRDVHAVLLTHIHLDHGGAAGTIVRRYPHVRVYVHARGAPHLSDPAKLLASAARLYGDQMERLWGESVAVPAGSLVVPADGDVLDFGGAAFDVAYTAGHASHHVCYRDRRSGVVYAGDTAGIRVGPSPYVLPPTPPPDIDVRAWQASLARLRAWGPTGVFVTHFGLHRDAAAHLDALSRELDAWEALAGTILNGLPAGARVSAFVEAVRERVRQRVSAGEVEAYGESMSLEDCWAGLERYWVRLRDQGGTDDR
jgi:glyoxylase-like metal-dependent hydrolase (beta-lactamase superfamily II)